MRWIFAASCASASSASLGAAAPGLGAGKKSRRAAGRSSGRPASPGVVGSAVNRHRSPIGEQLAGPKRNDSIRFGFCKGSMQSWVKRSKGNLVCLSLQIFIKNKNK
jgi:hypothetical protein